MDDTAAIVIGYDDSEFARYAVRRGLWLAEQLKVPARVICAWTISTAPRPKTWEPGYVPPVDDFAAAVIDDLNTKLAPILAEFPGVSVSFDAPHGAAGRELVKASGNARIMVVGSRGLGGFSGLLLGSVSGQVVEHAKCDVLVVRPEPDSGSPAGSESDPRHSPH